jgi:PAS domain S-box-containing protein
MSSGPVILHIEDNETVRYTTGKDLRRAGFAVQEAKTAEEGLRRAHEAPDLVLLDIQLPDMSGFEVCRRLKSDPATAAIPVLHLTSTYGSSADLAAGLEGGADGYLTHPVEPIVLVATIRALLRARVAEREVRIAARHWQATFDAIAHGVVLLDLKRRILRCNRTMAAWLERTPEELVGTDATVPLPGAARPAAGWPEERACVSKARESSEVRVGERWFEVSADPVFDEAGTCVGFARSVLEISDRKRIEAALELEAAQKQELLRREAEARAAAEQANRLKDDFLATLSHELRTPLNAILGWAQLLHTGTLDGAGTARAVETIERNAKAQSQLIGDILEVSRITSGKLRLELHPLDVKAVVRSAVDTVRPGAQAKGILVEAALDDPVEPVLGDSDRLQQVVWNLLSNAIKFTPKGGRVQVIVERASSQVEIVVRDSGQGIDPAFLPHVFDRFRQADSSAARVHGGLGLGLAIVRHLVELHGGTVHAESPGSGGGATFFVRLPALGVVERAAQARTSKAAAAIRQRRPDPQPDALEGVRVLVVEDHPDTLELVARALRDFGAEVVAVPSVREAREALRRRPPDVLLSDIGMPEEDGFALIRLVRELPVEQGGAVPAVALTAFAGEADHHKILAAGFQAHVAKPVEPLELVSVIAGLRAARP